MITITKCPTAYAAGCRSRQGEPVSDADKEALRLHDLAMHAKQAAFARRASERMTARWHGHPEERGT